MAPPREIWFGPVNGQQVALATAGGDRAFVTCTGDGSDGTPTCGTQADALADAQGRHLPNLLTRLGFPPDDEVVGACFSAGGSAWKRILMSAADRQQTRALHLADGTYTQWRGDRTPDPSEGFVLYGLDCLGGDRLFVATASASANKDLPNGVQTLRAIEDEIARRSGVAFVETADIPGTPPAQRVVSAGGIVFAYYPDIAHGAQATQLGPLAWQNIIAPWLAGDRVGPGPGTRPGLPAPAPEGDAAFLAVAAVAGVAGGYAVARWLGRRA